MLDTATTSSSSYPGASCVVAINDEHPVSDVKLRVRCDAGRYVGYVGRSAGRGRAVKNLELVKVSMPEELADNRTLVPERTEKAN